jgi:hypothetical protein
MTGTPFVPAMIVVLVMIRIRKIIDTFKNSGTLSSQTAKSLGDLNIRKSFILKRLVRHKVLVENSFGQYYLQEDHLEGYYRNRRIKVIIIAMILMILICIDVWLIRY